MFISTINDQHPYLYIRRVTCFLILSSILSLTAHAQTKYEKEKRINAEEVPQRAIDFSEKIAFDKKIKWYKELSQKGISYELKTKYKGHQYSIEFDTSGQLLDVEKTIKFKDLANTAAEQISTSLEQVFDHYKISKIQVQWRSVPSALIELIEYNSTAQPYELFYEIVLKGRQHHSKDYYEVLCDASGQIIELLRIEQRNLSNLEF